MEVVIQKACKGTSGNRNTSQPKTKGKTVPWWANELKILRKKTNAMRRRYQRQRATKHYERVERPNTPKRRQYQAAVRKEKTRSWKEYCSVTSPINPWNEVYKLASNKHEVRQ